MSYTVIRMLYTTAAKVGVAKLNSALATSSDFFVTSCTLIKKKKCLGTLIFPSLQVRL